MDELLIDINDLLERTMSDEEVAKEVLNCFIIETEHVVTKIKQSIDNIDLVQIREFAHELKGASASAGAIKIMKLSESMQKLAEQENYNEIKNISSDLYTSFQSTITEIKSLDLMK